MPPYPAHTDLAQALAEKDALVLRLAADEITLAAFLESYDSFYFAYALDGHESDAEGQSVLTNFANRIAPHRLIAETVLSKLGSTQSPGDGAYRSTGRIDSAEAALRIKKIAATMTDPRSNKSLERTRER